MAFLIFIALLVTAGIAWLGWRKLKQARRDRLFSTPLPDTWVPLLKKNVNVYKRLPDDLTLELHGRINIFLDEKVFIGCNGLTVTDEMKVTIAGHACLLLLKRGRHTYPGFTSILVYPDTYLAEEVSYDGLVERREHVARAGESWHRGPVVLSWSDITHGLAHPGDGHNVILHEFAHKLDEENAIMDGLPVLRHMHDYKDWAEVLGRVYGSLSDGNHSTLNDLLDPYGAESPAEFFAVATETFFEKPVDMQKTLPDLYDQFRKYYDLDPASWR